MPLTYVAHQVPALALKLGRPRWFDGTALALGSMSPDWPYALEGSRFAVDAHGAPGFLLVAVPTAIAATLVTRRLAPVAAGYLPEAPGLPLRRLRSLGAGRPPLRRTLVSAFLGTLSHVGWDTFTHQGLWGARTVPWLRASHDVFGHAVAGAKIAQLASTTLGFAGGLLLLGVVLRRLPDVDSRGTRRPPGAGRFWAGAGLGAVAGLVWGYDAGPASIAVMISRGSLGLAGGAVLGTLLVIAARRRADSIAARRRADGNP
jgi:hypothetical protein